MDGGVEGGGGDPLVLGNQLVGVGVEVRDAADHRRPGDELVAVRQQPPEQPDILRVADDELVARVAVAVLAGRAVLRVVVQPDDLVPVGE